MIQVGIIGMGFMGGVHLRNWQAVDRAKVIAVCDANPIANVAKAGNLDFDEEELNLDGIEIYTDAAEMLANENLDAVSIALPTHLHKVISIQCLEAGVHVLCEKPMALSVPDCDAMIAAATQAGKHLMVAHCLRFWPEYVWTKQAVESGKYGKVLAANFTRLSFPPEGGSWFTDPAKSGGIALDLHIHDLDFAQYLFGLPKSSRSVHTLLGNGVPGHVLTTLDYNDGRAISALASWMMPKSFGFKMAFEITLEKATLILDSQSEIQLKVYPNEGESFVPKLADGDGYKGEIEYFRDLVTGTNPTPIITSEQARESVRMALASEKRNA